MAIVNPEHLLDQAERLVEPPPAGPPRQVDIRRDISAAYYSVFHFTMTALADEVAGSSKRASRRYALVYRTPDHRGLRSLCADIVKPTLPPKLAAIAPASGFGNNLAEFSGILVDLQEKRHRADYDPLTRFRTSDATLAIKAARTAMTRFTRGSSERRKTFLLLLLCPLS